MDDLHELLENSRNVLTLTDTNHFEGKILEAANSLGLVQVDLAFVQELFNEIDEHCVRLAHLAKENAKQLEHHVAKLDSLESEIPR